MAPSPIPTPSASAHSGPVDGPGRVVVPVPGGGAMPGGPQPLNADVVFARLTRYAGPPEAFLNELLRLQAQLAGAVVGVVWETVATEPPASSVDPESPASERPVAGDGPPELRRLAAYPTEAAVNAVGGGLADVQGHAAAALLAARAATHTVDRPAPLNAPVGRGPHCTLVLQPLGGGLPTVADPARPAADRSAADAVVALLIESTDEGTLALTRERLMLTAQLYAAWAERRKTAELSAELAGRRRVAGFLDRLHGAADYRTAALSLANDLAGALNADRVTLGRLHDGRATIVAVSHAPEAARHARRADDAGRALAEAAESGEACNPATWTIIPAEDGTPAPDLAAFAARHGVSHAVALPLGHRHALMIELPDAETMDATRRAAVAELAEALGPALDRRASADAWIDGRLRRHAAAAATSMFGPGHLRAKLATAAAAGGLAFAALVPVPGAVEAPFVAEADRRRAVAAPFAGTLAAVHVRPGDAVVAGQTLLAELDTRELTLERASIAAERAAQRREADLQRRDDPATARLADLEVQRLDAELALADHRLSEARIVAGLDGVVLSADAEDRVGAPVAAGQQLMRIGTADALRAAVLVPESEMGRVAVGAAGRLAAASDPGRGVGFTVGRVHPVAEVVGGRNIFRVEVTLDPEASNHLRPGVEGKATIEAGRLPLLAQWLRPIWHWWQMRV